MRKKSIALLKIGIVVALIGAFIWFLILSPMLTFQKYENEILTAAERYYEFHNNELPTGERVRTLSLSTLYKEKNLTGTYYAPISHDACSVEKSWVKVRKENGEYKYYVYLDCGKMKSKIDHEGPVIKLKGKDVIYIDVGEEYKEPGVESVIDKDDGKIDVSTVQIKGEVNNTKVGTYKLTYTAADEFGNKSEVERTIKVEKHLSSYIKKDLGEEKYYKGEPETNYVRFSNMYFRIVGFTKDNNIILVAEEEVANVPFKKIEKWLDEVYMKSFTKKAKKLLVKNKFCKFTIKEEEMDDAKECKDYTESRYAYIPSIIEINNAAVINKQVRNLDDQGNTFIYVDEKSFLKSNTMSWIANDQSSTMAYSYRRGFYGPEAGRRFLPQKSTYNYGVRPMIVISKKAKIQSGSGTQEEPYVLSDNTKGKSGTLLNKREIGEIVKINGYEFLIVDTLKDGTTKVITYGTLADMDEELNIPSTGKITFNPKNRNNYAYIINNKASKFVDSTLFETHEVEVPIYKDRIIYGEETKTKKYKLKLSPPNMYEMFSAQTGVRDDYSQNSYWLLNSSTSKNRYAGVVSRSGTVLNEPIEEDEEFGVRVVAFIKKGAVITSGDGSFEDPYVVK